MSYYDMSVKIVGTGLPAQYEFIYAFVAMLLIGMTIFIYVSPMVVFYKILGGKS